VALGEQRHGLLVWDNFYICEGILDARSLDDYARDVLPGFDARRQARQRREIIKAVAQLVAAAHTAGVDHNDLHTGNILIRWPAEMAATGSPPQLYLIDLPGIRLGGPLNWRRSRNSLAMLGGGWFLRLSRSELWRFWSTYLARRPEIRNTLPDNAIGQILRQMREHALRVLASRDKRSLRTNRHFQRLTTAAATVHAVQEFPREQLGALADDPALLLRAFRHEPVKIGHASLLVQARLAWAGQNERVAYKRSRVRSWWKRCLGIVRGSRSIHGWQKGHALLARGIATPRPLAAIQPTGFFGGESYLMTHWIPGALNLHLYGWQLALRDPQERHRKACQTAESLGRLLGRMHAWRISHRDLKGCNLVVAEEADGVATYLIDLDSVRFVRRIRFAQQTRDLSRLAASVEAHPWLSRTVRLRFLRAYLKEVAADRNQWKPFWRAIEERTRSILAAFQRAGRPAA
jgi:tRNA A-37 threonylcarbamoyl transferase component Bud32